MGNHTRVTWGRLYLPHLLRSQINLIRDALHGITEQANECQMSTPPHNFSGMSNRST